MLHVRKCEKLLHAKAAALPSPEALCVCCKLSFLFHAHATHQDLAALVAAVYVTWLEPFDATGFVSLPSGGSSSLPSSTSRLSDLPNDALRQKSGG